MRNESIFTRVVWNLVAFQKFVNNVSNAAAKKHKTKTVAVDKI